jgi:hypothetical protein
VDRKAIGDLLIAATAEPERAKIFGARLAAGYGQHWGIHAITKIGHELVQNVFNAEFFERFIAWSGQNETRTLIFHRDGVPATRGGVALSRRQLRRLPPEELISVPGATWIDERFVGDGIDLLDRMLREPPKNPLAIYSELNALLKRNYIKLPGSKSIPLLRLLPGLLKKTWFRTKPPSPPAAPPVPTTSGNLTLALYFYSGGTIPTELSQQHYRSLIETLARAPHIKATVGWTEYTLTELALNAPGVLEAYGAGVKRGQFETVCVLDGLPFPMLPAPDVIHAKVQRWEATAAKTAQLWAKGFAPLSGNLSPGWGEALRGSDYQYIALDERAIRRAGIRFDPTRPISIEGWPVVGFHRESNHILRRGIDDDVLEEYLQYLVNDYDGKTLPISIDIDAFSDLTLLDRFLKLAQAQGCVFVILSELASAHAQGTANTSSDFSDLERWTSTEPGRQLNAAFGNAWDRWSTTHALGERIQAEDRERVLPDVQRLALSIPRQHIHRMRRSPSTEHESVRLALSGEESVVERTQHLVRRWLPQLGPMPTLPEYALGALRLFEPHDVERKGNLIEIQISLPESVSPKRVAFLDHGVVIPSQWLGTTEGQERFLLVLDISALAVKDLVVLPELLSVSPEGLDVTPNRLCNPWLAVLLDQRGQVTSMRFQGREHLCGLGNRVRGYVLETGEWLRSDLVDAEISVTSPGPIYGAVTIRQRLPGDIAFVRRLQIGLSNPLLDCVTELHFPAPATMVEKLIVGEFDIAGEQVVWSLPLQAGSTSCEADQSPPVIFSSQDAIDIRWGWNGLRYVVHQATTRTYQYATRPVPRGIRLGLIASMPESRPDPTQLGTRPGLGFPGCTYHGRYTYRYAVHPISSDIETRIASYTRPLLWSFYRRR